MKLTNKILKSVSTLCAGFLMACVLASCGGEVAAVENLVQPTDWSEGVNVADCYVMASIGTSKTIYSDALHLAVSVDGLEWYSVKSNNAIYLPTIGTGHIRDPYIFRLNDGSFVLVAADYTSAGNYWDAGSVYNYNYWEHPSNKVYVAYSKNLMDWYGEHLLQLTNKSGEWGRARHVWSPRVMYNKTDRCYDIYWVGDDSDGYNRVYISQTVDFYSVKTIEEKTLFDPNYSVTGAFAVKKDSKYYMAFTDDEFDVSTGMGGDVQLAQMTDSWGTGHFSAISERYQYITRGKNQATPVRTENPCIYVLPDGLTWILLSMKKNNEGSYAVYGTTTVEDPASYEDASVKVTGLPSTSCATVSMITETECEYLLKF